MRSITSITVESESFHAINSEEEEAEKIYIVTFLHFLKHNLKKCSIRTQKGTEKIIRAI